MRKLFKHLFLGSLLTTALPLSVISCNANKDSGADANATTNTGNTNSGNDNQTTPATPKSEKQIWLETKYGDNRDYILEFYKDDLAKTNHQFREPETEIVELYNDGNQASALERNEFKFQLKILNPENIWWKYGFDLNIEYTYNEKYRKDVNNYSEKPEILEFGKDKPFKTIAKWIKKGKGDQTEMFESEYEKNIEPAILEFTITLPNIKGVDGKEMVNRLIKLVKIYDSFGYEYEKSNMIKAGRK